MLAAKCHDGLTRFNAASWCLARVADPHLPCGRWRKLLRRFVQSCSDRMWKTSSRKQQAAERNMPTESAPATRKSLEHGASQQMMRSDAQVTFSDIEVIAGVNIQQHAVQRNILHGHSWLGLMVIHTLPDIVTYILQCCYRDGLEKNLSLAVKVAQARRRLQVQPPLSASPQSPS